MSVRERVYEAIAQSLREFGYPDCKASMIADIHGAINEGKTGMELPHGIIGPMAENMVKDAIRRDLISSALSGMNEEPQDTTAIHSGGQE